MRKWAWAIACVLLSFARPAVAETFTTSDLSFDIETRGACVLVPEGRRDEVACAAIDAAPGVATIGGSPASYVFLAVIPLSSSKRYWLGVIRFAPPDGVEATQRALREFVVADGHWRIDSESKSTTAVGGDTTTSRLDFDVTRKDDPALALTMSFVLPLTTKGYVVETFVDRNHRNEATEHVRRVLETWSSGPRANADVGNAVIHAGTKVRQAWFVGAFAVVIALVVRDARSRSDKKPRRDAAAVDLPRYATARRLGALFALGLCASVVVELLSFTFSSVPLRALAALISFAVVAPMLLWVHRITLNARVLGCADVPTATTAVTWFFVPIASVFMPYRSLADVAASMRGPGRMDAVWRVVLFWIPMVGMYASRAFDWPVASTLCAAVAALAAWSMVVAIDQGQSRMLRKAKKKKTSARELVHAA